MLSIGFNAELLQEIAQRIGLCGEILGGGRGLFDHRGVLLGHLIHASNGTVDLMQGSGLFAAGLSNHLDMLADRGDLGADAGQDGACLLNMGGAAGDFFSRPVRSRDGRGGRAVQQR